LVLELVAAEQDAALCRDLLGGIRAGLEGRRRVPMPTGWPAVYRRLQKHDDPALAQLAHELALIFGQAEAVEALAAIAADAEQRADHRRTALATLTQAHEAAAVGLSLRLLDDPKVRVAAAQGLARYADERIATRVLQVYATWPETERHHLIQTLCARPATALALLDAMAAGQIERQAISSMTARQLSALGEPVQRRLAEVWGEVRPASADSAALIQAFRTQLTPDRLAEADVRRGRAVFQRTCQKCHKLFGEGESIGPDLTGANRISLDYLLENMLDPNALVGKDYQLTVFTLTDGRVVSGIIQYEDQQTIRIQTQNESLALAVEEIEVRQPSTTSMMPEGQLNDLSADEIIQLIAYLQHPAQVPLPDKP
jgi:putative heme-binding domain-containing protein